jgi:hypothetical protein
MITHRKARGGRLSGSQTRRLRKNWILEAPTQPATTNRGRRAMTSWFQGCNPRPTQTPSAAMKPTKQIGSATYGALEVSVGHSSGRRTALHKVGTSSAPLIRTQSRSYLANKSIPFNCPPPTKLPREYARKGICSRLGGSSRCIARTGMGRRQPCKGGMHIGSIHQAEGPNSDVVPCRAGVDHPTAACSAAPTRPALSPRCSWATLSLLLRQVAGQHKDRCGRECQNELLEAPGAVLVPGVV